MQSSQYVLSIIHYYYYYYYYLKKFLLTHLWSMYYHYFFVDKEFEVPPKLSVYETIELHFKLKSV